MMPDNSLHEHRLFLGFCRNNPPERKWSDDFYSKPDYECGGQEGAQVPTLSAGGDIAVRTLVHGAPPSP
jgi:hypothetical protein